jgi:beta-mannosidase
MAINWDYCEPWMTAAGNNLIAYPTHRKPCYYAIQSSLRPVLASARIPKFDWNAGELFSAQLWLLNDSPEAAGKTIKASVKLGGEVYPLLTWESGTVGENTNKIGPTVNWILPDVDADDMTLILDTGDGASSEYRLRYRPSEAKIVSRQLNV